MYVANEQLQWTDWAHAYLAYDLVFSLVTFQYTGVCPLKRSRSRFVSYGVRATFFFRLLLFLLLLLLNSAHAFQIDHITWSFSFWIRVIICQNYSALLIGSRKIVCRQHFVCILWSETKDTKQKPLQFDKKIEGKEHVNKICSLSWLFCSIDFCDKFCMWTVINKKTNILVDDFVRKASQIYC